MALERKHGIRVNLTHVTGLKHAAVCAEAGATSITIPVQEVSPRNDKQEF